MKPFALVFFLSVFCLVAGNVLPIHEDCLLPIDPGTCEPFKSAVHVARYGYDLETHKCVRFYSTGCSGNANKFETEGDCVEKCINYEKYSAPLVEHKVAEAKTENTTKTKRPTRADCLLPPITGICSTNESVFKFTPTFSYIPDMNNCGEFVNVGCLRNGNYFETREECVDTCIDKNRNSAPLVEHEVAEAKTENTTKIKPPTLAECILYIVNRNERALVVNVGCLHNSNSFKTSKDYYSVSKVYV